MIVKNKKAYYEYFILEEFDAGVVLKGSEVKSVRRGNISFTDSFIIINNNEVWLKNFKISRYKNSHKLEEHDDKRDKKLLLTKQQIKKIRKNIQAKGMTCIPLSVFIKNNRIKIKIGLAKGKKLYEKKSVIKERDIKRDMKRELI